MDEPNLRQLPVADPSVWTALDLRRDGAWVHVLNAAESAALEAQTLDAVRSEIVPRTRQRTPAELRATTERIADVLHNGRGLFLVRNFNVSDERDAVAVRCRTLACQIGALVPQNIAGDVIQRVTDIGGHRLDDYEVRGHRGRAAMLPHTDSADVACLFCIRSAKRGGTTWVASAGAIFNELLVNAPHYLEALHPGFYFDLTGKTRLGVSEKRLPIFAPAGARIACQYNKSRIEKGMNVRGLDLSDAEAGALEYVSRLALREDLALPIALEPGDVLLLANRYVLHGRDEYEDWPEPIRKRLLLRLWLELGPEA